MTYILAIDTTLGACSAALIKDGNILGHAMEVRARGHVERLLPMVSEICDSSKVDRGSINYIAVTIGPGTFAGARIGLSAAKGMALGLNIPVIPITTLEAIADHYAQDNINFSGNIAVAIDARRGEVYLQSFHIECGAIKSLNESIAVAYDQVESKLYSDVNIIVGSGVALLKRTIKKISFEDGYLHPDAQIFIKLAEGKISNAMMCDNVSPLYLRVPDAVPSKKLDFIAANHD